MTFGKEMSPIESHIFKERYDTASKYSLRFQRVYSVACLGLLIAGAFLRNWPMIGVAVVCYPVMQIYGFTKWSRDGLLTKIRRTSTRAEGVVIQILPLFNLTQVSYSYRVGNKRYRRYDLLDKKTANTFNVGQKITVSHSLSTPGLTMIKETEQGGDGDAEEAV